MTLSLSFINAVEGDFTSEADLDNEAGRSSFAALVEDMTRRGYALFLEDGGETHRIVAYDAQTNEFEVRATRRGQGQTRVHISDAPAGTPAPKPTVDKPARGRPRVTGVPPSRGG